VGLLHLEVWSRQALHWRDTLTPVTGHAFDLPEMPAGEYWLHVFGDTPETNGTYSLWLQAPVEFVTDPVGDVGDTTATAAPLPVGAAGTGTVTSVIDRLDDADLFAFDLAAGQKYFVTLQFDPSRAPVRLTLLNARGEEVGGGTGSLTGRQALNVAAGNPLTPAGRYYLKVTSWGTNSANPTNEYTLSIRPGSGNLFGPGGLVVSLDEPPPAAVPEPPPPTPPSEEPRSAIRALLVRQRRGKSARWVVRVLRADTGQVEREFVSPFQSPGYTRIAVGTSASQGDGVADTVVVTAQRGRRQVRREFTV
jgi:hypothetical protein